MLKFWAYFPTFKNPPKVQKEIEPNHEKNETKPTISVQFGRFETLEGTLPFTNKCTMVIATKLTKTIIARKLLKWPIT